MTLDYEEWLEVESPYESTDMRAFPFVSDDFRVIDGDTLKLNDEQLKIRLMGIDAPEMKQTCTYINTGEEWYCGIYSKDVLTQVLSGKQIGCTDEGKGFYGRQLSYCYADGV